MRCKHPLKKSISSACWPILRSSCRRPALLPPPLTRPQERVPWPLAELAPPAVQYVRVDFKGSCHLRDRRPYFHPLKGGQLELPSEPPSRQSHDSFLHSLDLNLNWLSQKRGQLQINQRFVQAEVTGLKSLCEYPPAGVFQNENSAAAPCGNLASKPQSFLGHPFQPCQHYVRAPSFKRANQLDDAMPPLAQ